MAGKLIGRSEGDVLGVVMGNAILFVIRALVDLVLRALIWAFILGPPLVLLGIAFCRGRRDDHRRTCRSVAGLVSLVALLGVLMSLSAFFNRAGVWGVECGHGLAGRDCRWHGRNVAVPCRN